MSINVTYNGKQLPDIIGPFSISESYEEVIFSCNFLVKQNSSSSLISECNQIESKMKEPFNNIVISFDSGTNYNLSHEDNTCLNSHGFIEKSTSELDTKTSRSYKFTFRAELPADKDGFDFRRRGDFSVSETPGGLKRVVFYLEYTASASPKKTSDENFDSFAQVYAEGVLSTVFQGVTFDLLEPKKNQDQERKITTGSLVYTEIKEPESSVAANDPNIKNAQYRYDIDRVQTIGVSSGGFVMVPNTRVFVNFSADVVIANFSNQEDIPEYYKTNIKPHIIARSIKNLDLEGTNNTSSSAILESDRFSFDPVNLKISGNITFIAPSTVSDIYELSETIQEDFDSGLVTQKLWDGKEFTKSGYHMGSEAFIVRITNIKKLGSRPNFPTLIENNDLVLKTRKRSGIQQRISVNSEIGQETELFIESFVELYEKCVIVENIPIPIPNPNPTTFVPGLD